MKKLIALMLGLVMLLSLTACMDFGNQTPVVTRPTVTQPPETQPPVGNKVGNICPGAVLPIVTEEGDTGKTIDPTKTGKVTVINFWGTWCGPCVNELPHLNELARNYSETLTVVAIHSLEQYKKMPQYLAENYVDSPIIFSWETEGDYNGDYFYQLGGGTGYPYTVVLDANGIITETRLGSMTYEEMQEMVEKAGATESKITEVEPAVTIPQAQVTDAYTYTMDTNFGTYCYHVPKIILPDNKASDVNRAMYDHLYPMVEEAEKAEPYTDYILEMQYSMWQSGEIVSVVITVTQPYNDFVEFFVYNISAVTGKQLSQREVYEHFGLTAKEGMEELVAYLDSYWDTNSARYDDSMTIFIEETYSQEYLDAAEVFVGPDGTMCFTTKIGIPAGAGFFNTLINPNGELFYISCNIPGHGVN